MAGRKQKRRVQVLTELPTRGHTAKPVAIDGPTPDQLAKGGYTRAGVYNEEDNTRASPFISTHSPVERWWRAKRLSDSQMSAIALLRHLWAIAGLSRSVTANYGERIPGMGNVELRAATEIEARRDLHRIQDYVPSAYWSVFENVVRHDEPAGVAGSRLGFGDRTGDARAHTIVCFVADVICMKERL